MSVQGAGPEVGPADDRAIDPALKLLSLSQFDAIQPHNDDLIDALGWRSRRAAGLITQTRGAAELWGVRRNWERSLVRSLALYHWMHTMHTMIARWLSPARRQYMRGEEAISVRPTTRVHSCPSNALRTIREPFARSLSCDVTDRGRAEQPRSGSRYRNISTRCSLPLSDRCNGHFSTANQPGEHTRYGYRDRKNISDLAHTCSHPQYRRTSSTR